jgi:alkylation response protein AidB-like acyl-CoA dehydrogenase
VLAAARALRPLIEANADQIEQDCKLTDPVVEAMAAAGLFTMLVPRELGGAQVDPGTCLRVIEEIARADGSTAWCLMVDVVVSLAAGSLRPDAAREIWGHDPRALVAGSGVGAGRAVVADGGYRVSGRWSFASGCQNSTWLIAMPDVIEGETPRIDPNGLPETCFAFLRTGECRIVDNWEVAGLRGTGSHDFEIEDVFVPEERTHPRSYSIPPRRDAPLYTFGAGVVPVSAAERTANAPWVGMSSIGMAAALLGMARGALDAFAELAASKTPSRRATVLRDDLVVQDRFGRAEARLRAARALLYQTTAEAWQAVLETGVASADGLLMLRMASAHAAETAVEVVETIWKLAGTSGIFTGTALDRRLRDVQVGAQNVTVSPMYFGAAGKLLLGSTR